jgi:hypothetical protein
MALKQLYAAQGEIPEAFREHYAEVDGQWMLQTDPSINDIPKLQSALTQERTLRRDTEKQLSDVKMRFEGVDVDEYHKLQDRVKGLDDAEIYDKSGIEVLVARRTESMKNEHERQMASVKRENDQLRSTAADYDRRWRQDRIKTALLSAVSKSGVDDPAIEDAVQRGLAVFTDIDDDGEAVSKKGQEIVYGKDGISPLRPDEWISSLKASGRAAHLWRSSTGGGAPPGGGGPNGQSFDWNSITNPAERMTRFREHQAAQDRR